MQSIGLANSAGGEPSSSTNCFASLAMTWWCDVIPRSLRRGIPGTFHPEQGFMSGHFEADGCFGYPSLCSGWQRCVIAKSHQAANHSFRFDVNAAALKLDKLGL